MTVLGDAGVNRLGYFSSPPATTSTVFSITFPVTDIPVLTTAPVTDIAAPAAAPATETTAQPEREDSAKAARRIERYFMGTDCRGAMLLPCFNKASRA